MEKIESNCKGCNKETVCKYAEKNDEIRNELNNVLSAYGTNIFSVNMKCAYYEQIKSTIRGF